MPVPLPRWNKLSDYFMHNYGQRVQKIPLDAAASCPNRDGTLSHNGCIFCNAAGSGTGFGRAGLGLAGQWGAWCDHYRTKGRAGLFMAYLQSFSNTYGPLERMQALVAELRGLPDMMGLSVGTRPDCVDAPKLALLAAQAHPLGPLAECWLELGVQTCRDATLQRINRGHNSACSEQAIRQAAQAGLKVCVHLMAGLPGEQAEDFLDGVRWISTLPVAGVKFHNVYVCRRTPLADIYAAGQYTPLTQTDYVRLLADALPVLRPDIIVHRTTGDPASGELLAPDWALRSRDTNNQLTAELTRRKTWQGKSCTTVV